MQYNKNHNIPNQSKNGRFYSVGCVIQYELQLFGMQQYAGSTNGMMQGSDSRMRLKYEPIFNAHFANCVNELIYENIYTEYRVTTKDLLHWVQHTERMTAFVPREEFQRESLIAFNAQLFDSPLRITTEMPLMVLTDTREIFMRRKKRLRKLITNESSYSENSSSISPSSIFSLSTVVILKESLTNLSFMNLESSFNSYYSSSAANIYSRHSSMLKQQDSLGKLQSQEHLMIREIVQNEVRHLILEFHSKQSSDTIESVRSRKDYLQDFAQQIKEISQNQVKVSQPSSRTHEIESVVKAQLKKYKIGQVFDLSSLNSSSRASKTKKRVRDKAQELLRNIRSGSIIELSRA